MKIKANSTELLKAIKDLKLLFTNKSVLPILDNIAITTNAYENWLKLEMTNLDQAYTIQIRNIYFQIEKEGKITIPCKIIENLLSKIKEPNTPIDIIKIDDETTEVIIKNKSFYKINSLPYEDFPLIKYEQVIGCGEKINREEFLKAIEKVKHAICKDKTKDILNSIQIKIKGKELTVASTDGYRLSLVKIALTEEYHDNEYILPRKAVEILEKILKTKKSQYIYIRKIKTENSSSELIYLQCENNLFQSRLTPGNYPDWNKILPEKFNRKIIINKDELLEALELLSCLSKEDNNVIIRTIVKEDKVSIELINSDSLNGEGKEIINKIILLDNSLDSENLEIKVSNKFFQEALESFSNRNITINLTGGLSPFVINNISEKFTCLIMPIRNKV